MELLSVWRHFSVPCCEKECSGEWLEPRVLGNTHTSASPARVDTFLPRFLEKKSLPKNNFFFFNLDHIHFPTLVLQNRDHWYNFIPYLKKFFVFISFRIWGLFCFESSPRIHRARTLESFPAWEWGIPILDLIRLGTCRRAANLYCSAPHLVWKTWFKK